jgi:RNA polymerase sigma-70 factor (ECF subfamily)
MGVEFEGLTAPYRRELLAHCYRMSGSSHDAEDLLQETLLRAWRASGTYDEGRAFLRTWLYRIAPNACKTALHGRPRRPLPSGLVAALDDPNAPMTARTEVPWRQPWRPDPADVVAARGRLRLAFVAALQVLPPRQRATLLLRDALQVLPPRQRATLLLRDALQVLPPRQRATLLLRDVLEFPAAEVAATPGTSTAAVNSGLQRASARVGDVREDDLRAPADPAVVERYVAGDGAGLSRG